MKTTVVPEVEGALVIEMDRYCDDRGFFQEIFSSARDYPLSVFQANISCSQKDVVRGLHVVPFAKLCMCARGRLFDVVADVRPESPTYLGWFGVWLTEENCRQLFVPAGCGHGFFAAENDTLLLYMQDATYNPKLEWEVNWRDPKLAIEWPEADRYVLSPKDSAAGFLEEK